MAHEQTFILQNEKSFQNKLKKNKCIMRPLKIIHDSSNNLGKISLCLLSNTRI